MNTKNWNDRADKDLFFTILSVKNIGVISGSEWTTIGNHMRGLGYGFTNEGCRQHFQGLRRAQNKAETNGVINEQMRRDPTMNPITRRPGPGRGRPRKQPATPVDPNVSIDNSLTVPDPLHSTSPGLGSSEASMQNQGPQTYPSPIPHPASQKLEHPDQAAMSQGVSSQLGMQTPSDPMAPVHIPSQSTSVPPPEPLPLEEENEDEDDTDDHDAKRQRLMESELDQDPTLDDEAVLALAAHNGPGSADPYQAEFTYGEA
ncbi:hypothetical protein HJFPF1_06477 [Paramyrothecium foliicola]|nr:hypothetical protein HJFPF1_06477 [Paramyrothecium foliicola]